LKEIILYTDGACEPNPGPGGYGVVLIHGKHRKELSGGFRYTTNNRMELMAAIKGLEALKEPCIVKLHSDSEYVVRAMTQGWVQRWKAHGWRRSSKEPAANPDLWEKLLEQCQRHQVSFIWVKGHAGVAENERCDFLSMQAMRGSDLPADEGYEAGSQPGRQLRAF
jgi:ribonuclease HI